MTRLARLLRCTEGQADSAVIVAVVATVMVVFGLPPALRGRPVPPAAAAYAPAPAEVSAPAAAEVSAPAAAGASAPAAASTAIGNHGQGDAPPSPVDAVVASAPGPPVVPPVIAPASGGVPAANGPSTAAPGTVVTFAVVGDPGAPQGVARAPDGLVYVATDNGSSRGRPGPSAVIAYRPDGSVERRYVITGQPEPHTDGLTGLALDGAGGLLVVDAGAARVLRLNLDTGMQQSLATIPDLPACAPLLAPPCEPGVQDHRPLLHAATLDDRGGLLVSDSGQATIWRLDLRGGAPQPWYQSLDLASGDGPAGLTLAHGHVLFAVGMSFDVNALGTGAVYDLAVSSAGTAGTRTLVAKFGRGDEPDGVLAGSSGRTYVALRGADALVVLGTGHAEELRVTQSMDAPAGLAFSDRSLLVTDQSHTTRWAVLDVAVGDSPLS